MMELCLPLTNACILAVFYTCFTDLRDYVPSGACICDHFVIERSREGETLRVGPISLVSRHFLFP